MSDPLFSIVIPTFQSEQTIHSCLSSVLDQTFEDFEIIVQDGHSSDRTVEIVRSFKDVRIKLFSEEDLGVYDAMNRALKNAAGTWILFLGSDDVLFERTTLASLSGIVWQTEADILYGNVIMSGNSRWIEDGTIYRGETDLVTLFKQNLSHQAILYQKRIFKDGLRFNLDYPICADYDLNLRCFARYKTAYTPLIISVFAIGGISTQHTDERFEAEKWKNIIFYYGRKLKQPEFLRYKGIIKKTGKEFLKKGKYSAALTAYSAYLYFKVLKIRRKFQ